MRSQPMRTCVGCRARTTKAELLRVVLVRDVGLRLQLDARSRLPGRGAHVHPTQECLDLAERRRAFPRALRVTGPVDTSTLRRHVECRADGPAGQD